MASAKKRHRKSGRKQSGSTDYGNREVCLSHFAEQDLIRVVEFGIQRFGLSAAEAYFQKLSDRFQEIAENPDQFPRIEHIRPGYRRSVCGAHSIYFRVTEQKVEIIRVLGRQSFHDLG